MPPIASQIGDQIPELKETYVGSHLLILIANNHKAELLKNKQ